MQYFLDEESQPYCRVTLVQHIAIVNKHNSVD